MYKFLHSNDASYRLARTIVQGVIGVIIANIDLLFANVSLSAEYKALIVALVMAILSPIMASISGGDTSVDYDATEYNEGGEADDDPNDVSGKE